MTRRLMLALIAILGPLKGLVSACTEVKHGEAPAAFKNPVEGPAFYCLVAGYYTTTPYTAAGGARTWKWRSSRAVERRAELLVLRTSFLDWFLSQYQEQGGTRAEAIQHVADIVKAWRTNQVCVATEHGQEMRPRP